jgi:hypothetical protein
MNEYPISPEPRTVNLHSNLWWNIRRSPFILLRWALAHGVYIHAPIEEGNQSRDEMVYPTPPD